jgi:hypothetical protein
MAILLFLHTSNGLNLSCEAEGPERGRLFRKLGGKSIPVKGTAAAVPLTIATVHFTVGPPVVSGRHFARGFGR